MEHYLHADSEQTGKFELMEHCLQADGDHEGEFWIYEALSTHWLWRGRGTSNIYICDSMYNIIDNTNKYALRLQNVSIFLFLAHSRTEKNGSPCSDALQYFKVTRYKPTFPVLKRCVQLCSHGMQDQLDLLLLD